MITRRFRYFNKKLKFGGEKMPPKWTGRIVAALHTLGVTQHELASELGVTPEYVSMLLGGKRTSKKMEERMDAAVEAIAERKKAETQE